MLKMLIWDYEPFMGNPDGESLTLKQEDFTESFLIVIVNFLVSDSFDYLFGSIPFFLQFFFLYWNVLLVNFEFVPLKPEQKENILYLRGRIEQSFGIQKNVWSGSAKFVAFEPDTLR